VEKVAEDKINDAMIDELHQRFEKEMIRLFNRTKTANGYSAEDKLIIL
jgi:hypothetical protein